MLKIGNIIIKEYPLLLAPMEDITDASFRYICKRYGADIVFTEFVASEAIIRNVEKSLKKMKLNDYERPIAIQIYGHDINSMEEAAKIAAAYKPDFLDINAGCPVKKIATRGAGAGLLRDIPKLVEIAKRVVKAVEPLPVTLKTRLGWDNDSIVIEEVVEKLQDTGIQAITIHARTRNQFYKGTADWSYIKKIKENPNTKIQIIGNGDVNTPQIAKQRFEETHVEGIMIGRAAIGRPYIFKEIKHYLKTGELLPEPSIAEKVELAKEHFIKSLEVKGEPRGIYEMRSHFIGYFKGLPHFKDIKLRLVTSINPKEILQILDEIKEKYNNYESRT